MRQVLLILRKDVRHLWWQITAYAGLLAAYAWAVPQTWPGSSPSSFLATLVMLLSTLIVASQFVLITSAIHADGLVGENQFWITRPYDWRSLLCAKALFVIVCVVFPLALTQWYLVHAANLAQFSAIAGMVTSLLKFVLIPCLPIMVVASVTESIGAAFAFVAATLVVWAVTLQFILSGTDLRMSPPFELPVFATLFGILLLTVLAYQFALRCTTYSRIGITAIIALLLLLTFGYDRQGFGMPMHLLIRNHYEISPPGSLRIAFSPKPIPYDERGQDLQYLHQFVEIKLPIHFDGLSDESKIRKPNVAVTLRANGMQYTTPWHNASLTENALGFALPKEVYDRIALVQAALHVELIGEEIRPVRVQRVVAASKFPGISNASCILAGGKVSCRYAYQAMVPTFVEGLTETSACNAHGLVKPAGAWLLQFPAGGKLDPVVNENLSFPDSVCPGSTLLFTEYGEPHRFRLIMDVPTAKLQDYRALSH